MTTQNFTVFHDGRTTSGVKYFPERERFPVVVFAHGYNGEARDFEAFAAFLAKNGIGAVIASGRSSSPSRAAARAIQAAF